MTPSALWFAVSGIVPLAALAVHELRSRRGRRAIGEPHPHVARILPAAVGVVAIAGLLAVALAQPVREQKRAQIERNDVQVYTVLDTSKSMTASAGPGGTTRLERAKAAALELRSRFPDVPFGIASLTDRVLPHLFPTVRAGVFAETMRSSVGIERPPPDVSSTRASLLDGLSQTATNGYFTAPTRLIVVYTDGESLPLTAALGTALHHGGVRAVFVHVWSPAERIFIGGVRDPYYRADPASTALLTRAAALTGGKVFQEASSSAVAAAVQAAIGAGKGSTRVRVRDVRQEPLAKWFVLAAVLPVLLLVKVRPRRPSGRGALSAS